MQLLLYQLGELLNDPPIVINLPDWRDSIEDIMDEIEELSPYARDRLQDLISAAIRSAAIHVDDLDGGEVYYDVLLMIVFLLVVSKPKDRIQKRSKNRHQKNKPKK